MLQQTVLCGLSESCGTDIRLVCSRYIRPSSETNTRIRWTAAVRLHESQRFILQDFQEKKTEFGNSLFLPTRSSSLWAHEYLHEYTQNLQKCSVIRCRQSSLITSANGRVQCFLGKRKSVLYCKTFAFWIRNTSKMQCYEMSMANVQVFAYEHDADDTRVPRHRVVACCLGPSQAFPKNCACHQPEKISVWQHFYNPLRLYWSR